MFHSASPLRRVIAVEYVPCVCMCVRGCELARRNMRYLITYASAPGTLALEDPHMRNGYFTSALLHHIRASSHDTDVQRLFRAVRDTVKAATGDKQTPFGGLENLGEADVLLVPPPLEVQLHLRYQLIPASGVQAKCLLFTCLSFTACRMRLPISSFTKERGATPVSTRSPLMIPLLAQTQCCSLVCPIRWSRQPSATLLLSRVLPSLFSSTRCRKEEFGCRTSYMFGGPCRERTRAQHKRPQLDWYVAVVTYGAGVL